MARSTTLSINVRTHPSHTLDTIVFGLPQAEACTMLGLANSARNNFPGSRACTTCKGVIEDWQKRSELLSLRAKTTQPPMAGEQAGHARGRNTHVSVACLFKIEQNHHNWIMTTNASTECDSPRPGHYYFLIAYTWPTDTKQGSTKSTTFYSGAFGACVALLHAGVVSSAPADGRGASSPTVPWSCIEL